MTECNQYLLSTLLCLCVLLWTSTIVAGAPVLADGSGIRCAREDYLGVGCATPCGPGWYSGLYCQCKPCPAQSQPAAKNGTNGGAFQRRLRHCLTAVFNVCASAEAAVVQKQNLSLILKGPEDDAKGTEKFKKQQQPQQPQQQEATTTPGSANSTSIPIITPDDPAVSHNETVSSRESTWDTWGGLIIGLFVLVVAVVVLPLWLFCNNRKLRKMKETGPQTEPLSPGGGRDAGTHVFNQPENPH